MLVKAEKETQEKNKKKGKMKNKVMVLDEEIEDIDDDLKSEI